MTFKLQQFALHMEDNNNKIGVTNF